jgi:hypothetical protein
MSLKTKLHDAALWDAGLRHLLMTSSPGVFRWFDTRLPQGVTFPAVVVQVVSNPRSYVLGGKLPTSFARVQFGVYGAGADSANADVVVNAIGAFLPTFNAIGIPGLAVYPNMIVGDRDGGIAQTQPMSYIRLLDVMIFDNDLV